MGVLTSSWGDDGAESLNGTLWTGYGYAAACTWEPEAPDEKAFLPRFVRAHFGIRAGGQAMVDVVRAAGWQDFDELGWYGRMLHMKPVVRRRGDAWLSRMHELGRAAREGLAACEDVLRNGPAQPEQIEDLMYVLECFEFIANREIVLDRVARRITGPYATVSGARRRSDSISELEALVHAADRLAADYEAAWLRANRTSGLSHNLERLRSHGAALRELTGLARDGTLMAWTPGGPRAQPRATP
jgi:hypothetical protein